MRIRMTICDHCGHPTRTAIPYRVGDGPRLDICWVCQSKPFRLVTPHPRGQAVAEVIRLAMRE